MQVVAVTDPLELGFACQAMIGIRVRGELEPVADAIAELEEVDYVVITAGSYDLLVEVVCESDEALLEVLSTKIRALEQRRLDRDVHVPQAAQADLLLGRALSTQPTPGRTPASRCGTRRPATTGRPAHPCPATRDVDVAVVGAGLTGLWTAYYLLEADPRLRVVVLEAETAGFGASGRNGGWCSALFPAGLAKLAGAARLRPRPGAGPAPRDARHRRRGAPGGRERGHRRPGPQGRHRGGRPVRGPARRPPAPRSPTARRWGRGEDDLRLLDATEARRAPRRGGHRRRHLHPRLRRDPPRPARAWPGPRRRAARRHHPRADPGPGAGAPPGAHRPRHGPRRRGGARDRGLHPGPRRAAARGGAGLLARRRDRAAPPRRVGRDRPGRAGDLQRPPAPDRLRPAHGRRPAGLRRPRGAVPLRLPDPAGVRPRAAGLRPAARDGHRDAARAGGCGVDARVGRRAGHPPRLVRLGGAGPDDRTGLGRAATSATGSAPPTSPGAPCATWSWGSTPT